jgi:malate synthase
MKYRQAHIKMTHWRNMMNMPAFNVDNLTTTTAATTVNALVAASNNARWQSAYDLLENENAIFQMLDARFPLQERSHKDVKQYVVYYRHIMAFFTDGSHCGFDKPKQFAAYNGCKEQPSSILLRENGLHVELMFNRASARGKANVSGLEDVQIEFPTKRDFVAPDGCDYNI